MLGYGRLIIENVYEFVQEHLTELEKEELKSLLTNKNIVCQANSKIKEQILQIVKQILLNKGGINE